jgi:hypothetical protein
MKSDIQHRAYSASTGGVLCFSRLLLKGTGGRSMPLLKASQACERACAVNALALLESQWLNQATAASDIELIGSVSGLKWVRANQEQLKAEGMMSIAIANLPSSPRRQVDEIVQLLKKIRAGGTSLFIFDSDYNLIDIGSMDDVISSDDYLRIWVESLVHDAWIEGLTTNAPLTFCDEAAMEARPPGPTPAD